MTSFIREYKLCSNNLFHSNKRKAIPDADKRRQYLLPVERAIGAVQSPQPKVKSKPKCVKPKRVLWEYVVEPVDKATYWDKALPTEERRAKAKRLIPEEATVESVITATNGVEALRTEEQSSEAVKPKRVLWEYVVEPVDKATYWDISLPTEERRAKAKRLTVQELTGESESSEASSEDAESDNEPHLEKWLQYKISGKCDRP